jgi:hypothetical protein
VFSLLSNRWNALNLCPRVNVCSAWFPFTLSITSPGYVSCVTMRSAEYWVSTRQPMFVCAVYGWRNSYCQQTLGNSIIVHIRNFFTLNLPYFPFFHKFLAFFLHSNVLLYYYEPFYYLTWKCKQITHQC